MTVSATPRDRRRHLVLLVLLIATPLSLAAALLLGSVPIGLGSLWQILSQDHQQTLSRDAQIVLDLRLPRALAAFAAGALLALAGALMQVLLRNPLADPYILGVSGGAATGALCAMFLGLTGALVTGSAFAGALCAVILVFGLAHGRGAGAPNQLLLTGVVIAMGWGAVISLLLTLVPQHRVHGMLFWLMGDLSYAPDAFPALVVLILALLLSLALARSLNVLSLGEQQGALLGLPVAPVRIVLYFLASLLTAVAVTLGGSIGFVGLVVPHLLRLLAGSDHHLLLPGAALAGGCLLVLADTLARTLFAPQQIPVGVLTAFLGIPLFLFLLSRQRSGGA